MQNAETIGLHSRYAKVISLQNNCGISNLIADCKPTGINRGGARKIHGGCQVSSCQVRNVNSNVINQSCLTSSNAVNQTFLRWRSSMEKHFSCTRHQLLRETFGDMVACSQTKFSKITCSRTSENALLRCGKTFFTIDLHSGMGSMTPSSNSYYTNMEETKL